MTSLNWLPEMTFIGKISRKSGRLIQRRDSLVSGAAKTH
jgi:hypothetical protein